MTAQPLRIDERNHVEKPLLDQLAGLGWEILDLDHRQRPADSFRESFAEVVMLPVLREQLRVINPWLEEDQVEEAVRQLAHLLEPNHTARFWDIVRTHAPGVERARAWLREHGQLLEELIWRDGRMDLSDVVMRSRVDAG